MGATSLALLVVGIALIAIGYTRAKPSWARYQQLKAENENASRYAAWRGGIRDDSTTGASVAMQLLRREARLWGGIAIVGFIVVFAAFALR